MATCSLCGKEDLCFTCPYCNGVFCAEHRLPESHGCPSLHLARDHARRRIIESFSPVPMEEVYEEPDNRRGHRQKRRGSQHRFSSTEIKHLLISTILVILVSISIMGRPPLGFVNGFFIIAQSVIAGYWWFPVAVIGLFLVSFMVHEFAHKFTAQHYGLWSEFRMTTQGYYLSAMAILFSIPIFGTGVMYSAGTRSLREDGKINMAGPLSNAILATLFVIAFLLEYAITGGTISVLRLVFTYAIQLNAVLAAFNMIPIPPFDGATVIKWNRIAWGALMLYLVFMLILGYFVLPIL